MAGKSAKTVNSVIGTRCNFRAEVRAINEADYTVDVAVSDQSIDRSGTIILLSSWELDRYRQNPVLLWGHPLCAEEQEPEDLIGRALSVEVRGGALWCRFQYAVKENEQAAMIWRLIVGGFLKAFSIGAIVHDCVCWWDGEEEMAGLPPTVVAAMEAGECWCAITRAELIEVSQVFVGDNANALLRSAGAKVRGDFFNLMRRSLTRELAAGAEAEETEAGTDVVAADVAEEPEIEEEEASVTEDGEGDEDAEFERILEENPEIEEAILEILAEALEE